MPPLGWATLGVLVLYLVAFAGAGRLASRAAGRPIWLFGAAKGADRLAALGFRAAFALALLAPVIAAIAPRLVALDPLWQAGHPASGAVGHLLAVAGAMLAWAAQVSMGASWRVGVQDEAVGTLVTGGLYDLSRNPTFVGQLLLLAGVALAVPSSLGLLAVLLFWSSAATQVRSEERTLGRILGEPYRRYKDAVPRWIGWPNGSP